MTTALLSPYKWFRGFIQGKTRITVYWAFSIAVILSARHTPNFVGLVLCYWGAFLRFWASGYLRKDSRPAVGGPYAWIRNPLYLGSYLMAIGACLATEAWWLLGLGTFLFAVIYHFIILDEEVKLREIFGAPYDRYCLLVPRFFPRLWRASQAELLGVNPELAHHRHDWTLSWKNKSYEPFLAFAGIVGLMYLLAWFWSR